MDSLLSLGLDFGTVEARAMLVDMQGNVIITAAFLYPHGVMTECLPSGSELGAGFALQHPQDYIDALHDMIPRLFASGIDPARVVGIGVDFTQCTMMPVDHDGVPLCFQAAFRDNPYAYAKLWKHHAAQPQADRLTKTALRRNERFLRFCGGTVYAESMFPKILETYECAPQVYHAAYRFVELADWIPIYLSGQWNGSRSIAGCAALWNPTDGYPTEDFFEAAAVGFGKVAQQKLLQSLVPVGQAVGNLCETVAAQLHLPPGIPIAAGLGDCQAAFVGTGLSRQGVMLSVMGTSSCDMLVSKEAHTPPGLYGVTYDSMIPGLYGYEAGQANMGDLFRWFSEQWVPASYDIQAETAGLGIFDYLNTLAEKINPTQTGLVALDWWSGNRSVLLDTDLSGLLIGMTMQTRCEEVYYALMQALCFGKRRIVEQLAGYGVPVHTLRATGGVAVKNPFFMQMLADVLGIPVELSTADNGSCVGSAIYGALAVGESDGGFADAQSAAEQMGAAVCKTYLPRMEQHVCHDALYREYRTLYDEFGLHNPLMKRLKALREGIGTRQ